MSVLQAEQVRSVVQAISLELGRATGDGLEEVLSRLAAQDVSDAAFQQIAPRSLPVLQHLPSVLADCGQAFPTLAQAISALAPSLHWMQSTSYSDAVLGEGFSQNYGWAELIGSQGFFPGDDFILGFLMLGPERHYLDHYHPAPELYWPLSRGSLWKKGHGPFVERQRGEVIWHPSLVIHATITQERPLLAVYAWTRDVQTGAQLCVTHPPSGHHGTTKG